MWSAVGDSSEFGKLSCACSQALVLFDHRNEIPVHSELPIMSSVLSDPGAKIPLMMSITYSREGLRETTGHM